MASIFRRGIGKASDNLLNGTVLGVVIGLLIASSNIAWIQSIVSTIVNLIPSQYHFDNISYVVIGSIGAIVGYLVDRK